MKVAILIIICSIAQSLTALTVYTDTPYIRPFLNKALASIRYTDAPDKAELLFLNGLQRSVIQLNMHDYTIGIEDVALIEGKINYNVIYSFRNYKKILANITDVLSLHYPHEERKFRELLKASYSEIDAVRKSVRVNKKMIFRFGMRYDYLLDEFQKPYIEVDSSFVAREKAFREYNITTIFECEKMSETMKKSIDSLMAGYVYYDVSAYEQVVDLPIQLKTVMEAFSR